MDIPNTQRRRTKALKAKEKKERNPYSSKHVRMIQKNNQPK